MTTPIRVVIVDDHSVVREGVRHVLSDPARFTVVGEAANTAEAIALVADVAPDVIVLDVSLPGGSGLAAAPELLERAPGVRILMLSVHDDCEYVLESVRVGAAGFLRKDAAPSELRAAVEALSSGDSYFSQPITGVLAAAVRSNTPGLPQLPKPPRAVDILTPRELEILQQVVLGLTNREIGTSRGISTRTVEAHRVALMRKLGVHTVAGLTRLAIDQQLTENT